MTYILISYCILCWISFGWEAHKQLPHILDEQLPYVTIQLINFFIALVVVLSPLWGPFEWVRRIDFWRRKRKTIRAIKRLKEDSIEFPPETKQQFDETMAEIERFFEHRFRD